MDFFSLSSIQKKLQKKELSFEELFRFYLDKIETHNPRLNAFISLNKKAQSKNKTGRLAGIPIGIKDLFCTKNLRTTAGSKGLENYIPPYTATVVERLEQEGAIVIGKCNNDEFGMGSTGENSYFGVSPNPWNKSHTAGGSSSGSAAAVSAGLCPVSLGTDTGGSVRLPASYCHLVGLKPTYGRLSRYGMIAYASSLDQAGVFSHTVEDSALLLDIMSGFDPKDSTSLQLEKTQFQKNLNSDLKNKKVAYFDLDFLKSQIDPEVFSAYEKSLKILEQRGCQLAEKKFPYLEHGISVYYLISASEASSNLARYDGVRYGRQSSKPSSSLSDFYAQNRFEFFGEEVRKRILMGAFSLSTGYYNDYFHKACQVRYLIKQAFDDFFNSCEAIICPVSKSTAPALQALESKSAPSSDRKPNQSNLNKANSQKNNPNQLNYNLSQTNEQELSPYLNDMFTVFANLTGSPALSLPVSFSKNQLPIGMQLIGPALGEQSILNIALALEEDLKINLKRPQAYK